MNTNLITPFDIIYSIILIYIILNFAKSIQKKNIVEKSYYKYLTRGLFIKLSGGIFFCLIYLLYYGGGDTTNYFIGVKAVLNVFTDNPLNYFKLLFTSVGSDLNKFFFDVQSYPPMYMLRDQRTMTVIKITSLFSLLGLGGFLPTTILVATFIFSWIWKLYGFLAKRYPNRIKAVNICILYLPSTIFWGSGIMKDTFVFGATCYTIYGLHQFFIERKRKSKTLLTLLFSFYIILMIKAYIMFALLPGLLIFANFERLKSVKSYFIKIIVFPITFSLIILAANTLFFDFNELFGKYSADNLFEEAALQNSDLKRDVYGGNSFDIGEFDPTLQGAISKFLPALNAAIFRPYIWEVGSPTMLLSGIENTILLLISIWLLLTKPIKLIRSIGADPFIIFCLLFTITLGFGVGLSTSNFGALVRYKIPFLPFFTFIVCYSLPKLRQSVNPL